MASPTLPRLARLTLAAVVAAGCGHSSSRPKTAPTPSTNTVTSDDIHPAPGEPIEKVLQGRISGVDVSTGSDGSLIVRIRGQSTVLGGTQPLYVIDNVPVQPGPGGGLSGINPSDIESIRVLKDPADLTMYGSRAANGVIVIKTKRGKRRQ